MELIKRILAYFFTICSDMQQAAKILIKTVPSDKNVLRLSLSEIVMAHAIRRNVT
jgi:hypothetical protein